MTKAITEREWDDVTEWEVLELIPDLDKFQIAFMTASERQRYLDPSADTAELDAQAESKLCAEADAWREARRAKTLALAERLGCSVYLATYLLHLNDKFDRVLEAVQTGKISIQEPDRKRRKRAA